MANARQFMAARTAAWAQSGGSQSLDVVGSVYGDGSFRCIFTSPFNANYDYGNTGIALTCLAKFTPNTRGHFFTFGGDSTGLSLGHGASGASEASGNVINGLANVRWWAPTNYSVLDGLWHHYSFVMNKGSHSGCFISVDGVIRYESNSGSAETNASLTVRDSNITLLGVYDGNAERFLTGNVTRFCVYGESKTIQFIRDDYSKWNKEPSLDGLIHYYNGAKNGDNKLIDWIGGCNMSSVNGAQFSNEIP